MHCSKAFKCRCRSWQAVLNNALIFTEITTFSFVVGEIKDKISILAFITLQYLIFKIYIHHPVIFRELKSNSLR
jgi:hypothetical protein